MQCRGTGYRGRTGIFEVVEIDDELRELIKIEGNRAASYRDDHATAHDSLPAPGRLSTRCSPGVTTLDEVLRVT